jgi:hypothetical protein
MPLSNEVAPCNLCIDVEMYRIAEENGEDPNVSLVDLNQITKTSRYCCRCSAPFCADHSSPVDQSDCCQNCLPFEDIMEMKTPLISQDKNGTHVHKGYRLVPTGPGYKTLPKAISQMTDLELEAFITEKGNQIHQIERQRDYLRVAQSTAKLEKGEREIAAQRALKGIKLPPGVLTPSNKGIKITGGVGKAGNGVLKGVAAPPGVDLAAFLKFATDAMAKKKVGYTCPQKVCDTPEECKRKGICRFHYREAVPIKASPSTAVSTGGSTIPVQNSANAPAKAVVDSGVTAATAVTAKKGGEQVDGPGSPLTKAASLEEQIREAEIEKILNDDDIPF